MLSKKEGEGGLPEGGGGAFKEGGGACRRPGGGLFFLRMGRGADLLDRGIHPLFKKGEEGLLLRRGGRNGEFDFKSASVNN